jgi:hypothetical protein
MPVWAKLKAVAHTIPYDGAIVQDNQRGKLLPADRWTCVMHGTDARHGRWEKPWMDPPGKSVARERPEAWQVLDPIKTARQAWLSEAQALYSFRLHDLWYNFLQTEE